MSQTNAEILAAWTAAPGAHLTARSHYNCVRAIAACSLRLVCRAGRWESNRYYVGRWVDHARAFVRDRCPAIYVRKPYDYAGPELVQVCQKCGLVCFVYPRAESWYNPGGTHLIVFVASADRDRYFAPKGRRQKAPIELLEVAPLVGTA